MNQSDELSKLLDEFEDAVWCSRGDYEPQNAQAKIRASKARSLILANFIAKSQVVKAIGEEEVPATHDSMALAIIKNGLRSDIRHSLSLDGGEGE